MVATKRRFNPNLQKVRIDDARHAAACLRLHPMPQSRQGEQGRLIGHRAWPPIVRFRKVVAAAYASSRRGARR